jgi:hypothetical protein
MKKKGVEQKAKAKGLLFFDLDVFLLVWLSFSFPVWPFFFSYQWPGS